MIWNFFREHYALIGYLYCVGCLAAAICIVINILKWPEKALTEESSKPKRTTYLVMSIFFSWVTFILILIRYFKDKKHATK